MKAARNGWLSELPGARESFNNLWNQMCIEFSQNWILQQGKRHTARAYKRKKENERIQECFREKTSVVQDKYRAMICM